MKKLTTEERLNIVRIVKGALKEGIIKKSPCEVCGSLKVDGHHDDYSKPLEIRWLCETHHIQFHLTSHGKDIVCQICGKEKPCGGKKHSKKNYQKTLKGKKIKRENNHKWQKKQRENLTDSYLKCYLKTLYPTIKITPKIIRQRKIRILNLRTRKIPKSAPLF